MKKKKKAGRRRPGAVTLLGILLLLQAAGLLAAAASYLLPLRTQWPLTAGAARANATSIFGGALLGLLAIVALLSAFGIFRVWAGAWRNAVMVQGLMLLIAVVLYFHSRPIRAYAIMIFGIAMVIYLHHWDVQAVFRPKPAHPNRAVDR